MLRSWRSRSAEALAGIRVVSPRYVDVINLDLSRLDDYFIRGKINFPQFSRLHDAISVASAVLLTSLQQDAKDSRVPLINASAVGRMSLTSAGAWTYEERYRT